MEFLKRNKKNTSTLCIKGIKEQLDLVISDKDIDRTHRIGSPRNAVEKPRPMIIKQDYYEKVFPDLNFNCHGNKKLNQKNGCNKL